MTYPQVPPSICKGFLARSWFSGTIHSVVTACNRVRCPQSAEEALPNTTVSPQALAATNIGLLNSLPTVPQPHPYPRTPQPHPYPLTPQSPRRQLLPPQQMPQSLPYQRPLQPKPQMSNRATSSRRAKAPRKAPHQQSATPQTDAIMCDAVLLKVVVIHTQPGSGATRTAAVANCTLRPRVSPQAKLSARVVGK